MKNNLKLATTLMAILLFSLFTVKSSLAQKNSEQKKIRLKIEQNNNGKVISIDTTLTVGDDFNRQQFLQSRGFDKIDLPPVTGEKVGKMIIVNEVNTTSDSSETINYLGDETGLRETVIANTGSSDAKALGPISGIDPTLEVKDLGFFPNPTDGVFTLKFSAPANNKTTVYILDITGRKVYEESLAGFSGSYENTIDISENGKGTYFIEILQGNKSMVKKVTLQ